MDFFGRTPRDTPSDYDTHQELSTTKAMIGKVGLGNYALGILEYCYYEKQKMTDKQRQTLSMKDVRGELIYLQHLSLRALSDGRFDMNYVAQQLLENRAMNKQLTKFIWHQSFSFPDGENPTNDQIQMIAEKFAKEFGFENNQLIVFKHHNTKHQHFHIVANRININGKNTADHFKNYQRTGEFCRKVELEMGLQVTPNMHLLEKEKSISESQIADLMRAKVKLHLSQSKNIKELSTKLKKEGIKTHIGRGIAFTLTTKGVTFKGSDLGREYSLANLEKRIQEEQQEQIQVQALQQNNRLMNEQRLEEEQIKQMRRRRR
jgi:Relaxase/Mobilisation nuclease domain